MPLVNEVKHIFEPNPLACGQAVIAMLSGADVNDVISLTGTEREITLKGLKDALSHYGIGYCEERKQAQTVSDLPPVAVLSLETPRCWHWSLYFKGKIYDPEHGVLDDFPQCNRKYYWEIKDDNDDKA